MKLCVLLLSALLALSSARPQDLLKKSSQDGRVPPLNPELEGVVPKITGKTMVQGPPYPVDLKQQASHMDPRMFEDNVNLRWVYWSGSLPNGAVSIYNSYTGRTDYVCMCHCESGFYSPSKGAFCHYPWGDREYKVTEFWVLVNTDNFELLEWEGGSRGSVPEDSVRTCNGYDTRVGKNEFGLGKVVPEFEAFFLPFEGREYWYKNYDVLTINRDTYTQHIYDVNYGIDEVAIFQYPPETMQISGVTNNECKDVSKTVSLSKTVEVQTTWGIGRSTMVGTTSSITAKIPFVGETGIELSAQTTQEFSQGTTLTESISHNVELTLTVPANHYCRVIMEGRKLEANIPYTARLSRTYHNGDTRWTSIVGEYEGVHMGEVRAVVDRCEPVADAEPCP